MSSDESLCKCYQNRLDEEIASKKDEISNNLTQNELLNLKTQVFPSKSSYQAQEIIGKQLIQDKEEDLKNRMKNICALESHIIGIEKQLSEIIDEKESAIFELEINKNELNTAITELVRFNKLMELINKNITDKIELYQQQTDKLEQERIIILNDSQLSPAEKERKLMELNDKIVKLKESHESAIKLLDERREEIDSQSKSHTEKLSEIQKKLTEKYKRELNALELRKKMATTAAEVEGINIQILKLNKQFDIDNALILKTTSDKKYFVDNIGRYYVGSNDKKIYKLNSLASEYILNDKGDMIKIKGKYQMLTDDIGDYFINEFGKKEYIRKYLTNEHGQYYTDNDGNRIYCIGSNRSEYLLIDGNLIRKDEIKNKPPIQTKIDYIKESLGLPLKKAIASTVIYQPSDPIEYIANYLIKYRESELRELEKNEFLQELIKERSKLSR